MSDNSLEVVSFQPTKPKPLINQEPICTFKCIQTEIPKNWTFLGLRPKIPTLFSVLKVREPKTVL